VRPGELRSLLERCRTDDTTAWEQFTRYVQARREAALGAFTSLSSADRDDVVSAALDRLVSAVRCGRIRGNSNSEIDAYVCETIRNQALNFLRNRERYRETDGLSTGAMVDGEARSSDVADDGPSQEMQAITSEWLRRAIKILESWSFADQYLFFLKIHRVPSKTIRHALRQFRVDIALATVDTRFHRLREKLLRDIEES
jgi:DNA-directed RNA polymerase specialized sigma24 family protein